MASRHPGILILPVSPSSMGISILHRNVVVCGDLRIRDVEEALQLLTGTFPPEESPWLLTGIFHLSQKSPRFLQALAKWLVRPQPLQILL